jgi:phosphomannomutase
MTPRLFGTDGVRGVAGELLSAELALALGKAATGHTGAARPRVLIVRDTRESGQMLEAALAAGVSAAGGEALLGGVLPTPAAPLLVKRYGFDLAAVISASHNPFADNGIKFFAADGFKLSDETEHEIEAALGEGARTAAPTNGADTAAEGAEGADGVGAEPRAIGHVRDLPTRTICASWKRASSSCASMGATSRSTAPMAPPIGSLRRSSGAWVPM